MKRKIPLCSTGRKSLFLFGGVRQVNNNYFGGNSRQKSQNYSILNNYYNCKISRGIILLNGDNLSLKGRLYSLTPALSSTSHQPFPDLLNLNNAENQDLNVNGNNGELEKILKKYAHKKPNAGTLQQMIAMSNPKHRLSWAPHLQQELLVRISNRYEDFLNLPQNLLKQPTVKKVTDMYADYLQQIEKLQNVDTPKVNRQFIQIMTEFKAKDSSTLPYIAIGIKDLHNSLAKHISSQEQADEIDNQLAAQLDDLFTARLSIRMLIGQYCEYANPDTPGRIERGLVISEVARVCAERVTKIFVNRYNMCPKIVIEGNLDSKLTYVRSYLEHILVELLKNSARAVIESRSSRLKRDGVDPSLDTELPDIQVVISGGKEDCVIKVSDEGGGIARSDLPKIWSYQFTSSPNFNTVNSPDSQNSMSENEDRRFLFREGFFGSGYGLPIARVFARYFGGDLSVISTEGWGTDAYVHLRRVESSACEVLPD